MRSETERTFDYLLKIPVHALKRTRASELKILLIMIKV